MVSMSEPLIFNYVEYRPGEFEESRKTILNNISKLKQVLLRDGCGAFLVYFTSFKFYNLGTLLALGVWDELVELIELYKEVCKGGKDGSV